MPVAILLIIAALLPLLSFIILVAVGKRMGNPLAGIVGTFFIAISFGCSLAAMIVWLSLDVAEGRAFGFGGQPVLLRFDWIPVGHWFSNNGYLQLGVYVDSLTIVMFSMITLVAALIHVFSIGYMAEDNRFPRFFTYLSLFCFSMLGLVLGGTLLQLFIFWELVGLCSYLLIGFWYEKKTASNAAIKAFVVNRIGDVGFIIGVGLLFFNLGNVTLPDVWQAMGNAGTMEKGQVLILPAAENTPAASFSGTLQKAQPPFTQFPHMTTTLMTVMGIGLFFGAAGKSAQFPLHVWLPDAMEGPTPVSALIHAATMVAAGVYLVGRIFPILTPDAKLFIAVIGCITLTLAALIAMVQTDIKRMLAYSTVSQLGYMMLALGIGSWVGGLFHLVTHAFFKSLLFLCAGSVIRAADHELELTEYGGLWRKIPYTAIAFGIGVLAIAGVGITIAGVPLGFAGYYSKDLILHHAGAFSSLATAAGKSKAYWLLFILPAVVACITAFYMTRCWILTFTGKPRNQDVYQHANETPVMYIPLVVLAALSVIGGSALGVRTLLESAIKESNNYFRIRPASDQTPAASGFAGFTTAWQNDAAYHFDGPNTESDQPIQAIAPPESQPAIARAFVHGEQLLKYASLAFVIGITLGVLVYWRGFAIPRAMLKFPPLRWLHTWLYHAMYFDEMYTGVFLALTLTFATLAAVLDRYVVDAAVNLTSWLTRKGSRLAGLYDDHVVDGAVNRVVRVTRDLGAAVRAPQTGRIRGYVTLLMVAVAICLASAIIVVLSTTH
jgi:proton-translocating NADH-quinone oxidoreductase chain L